MDYLMAALQAIKEFFGSFKFLDKWFTKTTEEKVKAVEEDISDLEAEFRKNGGRNEK